MQPPGKRSAASAERPVRRTPSSARAPVKTAPVHSGRPPRDAATYGAEVPDAFTRLRRDALRALAAGPFYRHTLIGPVPADLRLKLNERWPGDAKRGAAVLAGEIEFFGELVRNPMPVWFPPRAGPGWLAAWHGFGWLADLIATGAAARDPARALVQQLARRVFAVAPDRLAVRCRGDPDLCLDRAFRGDRRARSRPAAAPGDAGEHRPAGAAPGAHRRLGTRRPGTAARGKGPDRRAGRARRLGKAHGAGAARARTRAGRFRSWPMAATAPAARRSSSRYCAI